MHFRIFMCNMTVRQGENLPPFLFLCILKGQLSIKCGRWNNIEICYRIFSLCNKNTLGDEYHNVMKCHALSLVHNKLIDYILNKYER